MTYELGIGKPLDLDSESGGKPRLLFLIIKPKVLLPVSFCVGLKPPQGGWGTFIKINTHLEDFFIKTTVRSRPFVGIVRQTNLDTIPDSGLVVLASHATPAKRLLTTCFACNGSFPFRHDHYS